MPVPTVYDKLEVNKMSDKVILDDGSEDGLEMPEPVLHLSLFVCGEKMDFDEVTETIGFSPTSVRKKEEWPDVSKKQGFAVDEWYFDFPRVECRAISEQIDRLETLMQPHINEFCELCHNKNYTVFISIAVDADHRFTPELCLEKRHIDFIGRIGAGFGIDPYLD